MYPGYGDEPYRSPIRIGAIKPLKTGQGLIRLNFLNAFYAVGVRQFDIVLRTLKRSPDFIALEPYVDKKPKNRLVVIHEVSVPWMRSVWPEALEDAREHDLSGDALQLLIGRKIRELFSHDYG